MEDLLLANGELEVRLKDSRFKVLGQGAMLSLSAEADSRTFLKAHSATNFPPFSLPLPQWLSQWPETKLLMHLNLGDDLVTLLTGEPGSVILDTLALVRDSLS